MANSDNRYEMLRDRELSKLSWVVTFAMTHPGRRRFSLSLSQCMWLLRTFPEEDCFSKEDINLSLSFAAER